MTSTFFSRPIRIFGKVSILVICLVLFVAPFAIRGARLSLQRMENNVKDWLPDDFPETRELRWFSQYFLGEQFILATWPDCTAADPRYQLLVRKFESELAPANAEQELAEAVAAEGDDRQRRAEAAERVRARQLGDRLGLLPTGDYHENWGGRRERWLQGSRADWYFITPEGELYRWSGAATFPALLWRTAQRIVRGSNTATGELVATFGEPSSPERINPYYADPRRLGARLFRSLTTGPGVVELLSKERGPLWPVGQSVADEDKPAVARRLARERLTGVLFGPALPSGFSWEADDFLALLPQPTRKELPDDWPATFATFVDRVVADEYAGDRAALRGAGPHDQTRHWETLFGRLGIEPPPRQTCLVLTLSELGKRDLRRTIGRPMLGRPPGKLQQLAVGECGITAEELTLGGPPVDNVAIDEEGTVTLFRLIGLSGLLGITLAWLCFRSFNITIMIFFVGGLTRDYQSGNCLVDRRLGGRDPDVDAIAGLRSGTLRCGSYCQLLSGSGRQPRAGRSGRTALRHGWGPTTLCRLYHGTGIGIAVRQQFGADSEVRFFLGHLRVGHARLAVQLSSRRTRSVSAAFRSGWARGPGKGVGVPQDAGPGLDRFRRLHRSQAPRRTRRMPRDRRFSWRSDCRGSTLRFSCSNCSTKMPRSFAITNGSKRTWADWSPWSW